jgi:uncharacterized membrane protein
MNLAPLLNASPVIRLHAFAAMIAVIVGVVQMLAPKGTVSHRALGWTWFVLIMVMLITAPIIHGGRVEALLDPGLCYLPDKTMFWNLRCAGIHLLTIYLLLALPFGPLLARRGYIAAHGASMIATWCLALLVAGIFTMDTGRIMHQVLFGD